MPRSSKTKKRSAVPSARVASPRPAPAARRRAAAAPRRRRCAPRACRLQRAKREPAESVGAGVCGRTGGRSERRAPASGLPSASEDANATSSCASTNASRPMCVDCTHSHAVSRLRSARRGCGVIATTSWPGLPRSTGARSIAVSARSSRVPRTLTVAWCATRPTFQTAPRSLRIAAAARLLNAGQSAGDRVGADAQRRSWWCMPHALGPSGSRTTKLLPGKKKSGRAAPTATVNVSGFRADLPEEVGNRATVTLVGVRPSPHPRCLGSCPRRRPSCRGSSGMTSHCLRSNFFASSGFENCICHGSSRMGIRSDSRIRGSRPHRTVGWRTTTPATQWSAAGPRPTARRRATATVTRSRRAAAPGRRAMRRASGAASDSGSTSSSAATSSGVARRGRWPRRRRYADRRSRPPGRSLVEHGEDQRRASVVTPRGWRAITWEAVS